VDFSFTEEQSMLRDTVAAYLADHYDFDKRRAVVTKEPGWRPEVWRAFAEELGILGAPFSEELGGLGGGPIENMVVMEEFGKALVVEPYLGTVVIGGGFLKHSGHPGAAELIGGVGLVDRRAPVRRAAGAWLAATLVAIFPANVHMARHGERFARTPLGRVALWARLPVQAVFIAWVIAAARRDRDGGDRVSRSPR